MAGKKNFDLLHTAISWGATVVILGAMFKILHLGGNFGNWMIGIGLLVEASLFFITGFVPPAKEPEWHRVYPELHPEYSGELPKTSQTLSSPSSTAALDKMLADADITPDLIGSLGDGLRTFGEKVSTISSVTDAATATGEFTAKLKTASSNFDTLSSSFEKASASLAEFADSGADTRAYHEQASKLAKNLSALNAVYELELQDSNTHLKSMNKFYENLAGTMQNFNESVEDSKQFKEEVARLAKNLSSLNAIYGNMLSAMNQPRA